MGTINIANAKGRDAVVGTESVESRLRVRWLDAEGRQATSVRILRGTRDRDTEALVARAGSLSALSDLLVAEDPEVDLETYGSLLGQMPRVYLGPDGRVVHRVSQLEIVRNPDGSERERRPRQVSLGNTSTEVPIKWSGRFIPKADAVRRFVFAARVQLVHVNGLTYDFLFEMARDLEARDALLLVGAGPKGNQPLVFHRNALPYRGFLEGRTRGDTYLLLLHLSQLELKRPDPPAAAGPPAATEKP